MKRFAALAQAIKEGATASQLKYKELNNETTKEKLTVSKTSIEQKKIEVNEQNKLVAMIEKELAYHQMKLEDYLSAQTRLNVKKYDAVNTEEFLKVMEELDQVNKNIDYHTYKIEEFQAEYNEEKETLDELKKDLVSDQNIHRDRLNRLIRDEEELEKQREMVFATTN